MLTHVLNDTAWSVVAVCSPFFGRPDTVRQDCLADLLVELSSRKVRRVVADARTQPKAKDPEVMNKQDLATARQLRQTGAVDRQLALSHGKDVTEPLLWMPDGVAWSVRRAMVADDEAHFSIIKSVTTIISVSPRRNRP
jgi:hypothetical protein